MCRDQKKITKTILDIGTSSQGSDTDSIQDESNDMHGLDYKPEENEFVQKWVREEAVIKILENGVRLCLKL